jgi:hypothetical protein
MSPATIVSAVAEADAAAMSSRRPSDEMSLNIVIALLAGVVTGAVVAAAVAGLCYLAGLELGALTATLALISAGIVTVTTLKRLERSGAERSQ